MCGREADYTRNQVLLRAFQKIGQVDVVVAPKYPKSLVIRSCLVAFRAVPKAISKLYDLVFVGFYGHLLMLPIGLLCKRPIIFDAFVSTFDTLTSDRQTYAPNSTMGKLAFALDRSACHLADRVLVDTPAQVEYFAKLLSLPPEQLSSLPVACNEDIFFPREKSTRSNNLLVLSYSTYLPIHGVETIIRSAKRLVDKPIQFRLIGDGPEYKASTQLARALRLENITFIPPVSLTRLADEIAASDVCLGGHFGTSDKATRVVPGKIYQMLAMRKPVIAADSLANKTLLQHGISAYLCSPGDPAALADAILQLQGNPLLRDRMGTAGREAYENFGSEKVVLQGLQKLISELIN